MTSIHLQQNSEFKNFMKKVREEKKSTLQEKSVHLISGVKPVLDS